MGGRVKEEDTTHTEVFDLVSTAIGVQSYSENIGLQWIRFDPVSYFIPIHLPTNKDTKILTYISYGPLQDEKYNHPDIYIVRRKKGEIPPGY